MSVMGGIVSWRTVLYGTYFLLLTAVLLWVRFPDRKFLEFCENRLEAVVSDSRCTIDSISYRFPLTVIFQGVQMSRNSQPRRSSVNIDNLSVTFALPLLTENIQLNASLYGGRMAARLEGNFAGRTFALKDIRMTSIDLRILSEEIAIVDRRLAGSFSLTGSYRAGFDSPTEGTGEGEVRVDSGGMQLLQPVLGLLNIEFSEAFCRLRYQEKKLSLVDGRFSGAELDGEVAGEIRLKNPLFTSELQLGGHIVPRSDFLEAHPGEQKMMHAVMKRYNMQGLPFRLGGTLSSPTFRFST